MAEIPVKEGENDVICSKEKKGEEQGEGINKTLLGKGTLQI